MSAKMNEIMRSLGRADALRLREEAPNLDGTEIIAREAAAPAWSHDKDYSGWKAGSPVTDEGQVWTLIQPHNASHYEGRPSTLRALWGLTHTKNPAHAKPWVDAYGTSGMYMTGECYKDAAGVVHRAKQDNLVHNADTLPSAWETVAV